jgi:hypothetical protein
LGEVTGENKNEGRINAECGMMAVGRSRRRALRRPTAWPPYQDDHVQMMNDAWSRKIAGVTWEITDRIERILKYYWCFLGATWGMVIE